MFEIPAIHRFNFKFVFKILYILDIYKFRSDQTNELNNFKWNLFGQPNRIQIKCSEVLDSNQVLKRKFQDEMETDQSAFVKQLADMEIQIQSLEKYQELYDISSIADNVKQVELDLQNLIVKSKQ